ncbi:PadR family transcriptional regulator [Catellatospora coxensis]
MSIGHSFLGLLEGKPRHGYDLKRAYDERFSPGRPLHHGQVYATLSRLLKNGLVVVDGLEPGRGPSASATRSPTPASPTCRPGSASPRSPSPTCRASCTPRSSSR